ncbi:MAG: low-specificity L-threonine aldolase [Candidatus Obscuribacterales bacterium]|nr:low-specificity L-threonine aldolase [Candidatus Obscuribacterales bacterium]
MINIDLRSDTVTLPPAEMREAMHKAELGDDVYGEDPTVNRLQEIAAERVGKEAGLFVPTGTMGNLIAMLTHVARGEEAIVGAESHIFVHEQGSASTLGGIHLKPLANKPDGSLDLEAIKYAISPDDDHMCRTKLVCLENTFGGSPLDKEYVTKFTDLAHQHSLIAHLDGARIFNAAVALGCKVTDLTAGFDTVQFCFSKGLAAPSGSMLCGPKSFIKEARRWRKALGGGMRQVGVLAAGCLYAVDHMVQRLQEDHDTAKALAKGISTIDGISVNTALAKTNMVWFDIDYPGVSADDFANAAEKHGLKILSCGPKTLRTVTHYGISLKDVEKASEIVAQTAKECSKQLATR